jgi:uncharacterized protein
VKIKFLVLPILFLFFSVQVFGRDRIVDNAGLLNASEKSDLIGLMDSIAATYNFDLVIVTETDIGNMDPGNYADDYFDDNGYGLGNDRDGCLFLRVMETRDYWFSTSGRGITVLNSYALQKLGSDTGKYLGENNYYAAFRAFILAWDQFLSLEAKGRNYNFFYQWNLVLMLIAWLVALVIGFLVVNSWKQSMNTALPKAQAAAYVVPGSLNLTVKKESFLYSKVSKTPRSTGTSTGSLGNTLRTSSSGRSHGGGGGRR